MHLNEKERSDAKTHGHQAIHRAATEKISFCNWLAGNSSPGIIGAPFEPLVQSICVVSAIFPSLSILGLVTVDLGN